MIGDYLARTPLTDSELDALAVLQRVRSGDVRELHGRYFYRGRPIVPWLDSPMTDLVDAGRIKLEDPEPESFDLRRAVMTADGKAHHETLCDKQGIPR